MRSLMIALALATAGQCHPIMSGSVNVLTAGDDSFLDWRSRSRFDFVMARDYGVNVNFQGFYTDGTFLHDAYTGLNAFTMLNGSSDGQYPGLSTTMAAYSDLDIVMLQQGATPIVAGWNLNSLQTSTNSLIDFVRASTSDDTMILVGNVWDVSGPVNDKSDEVAQWNQMLLNNIEQRRAAGESIALVDHFSTISNTGLESDGYNLNRMGISTFAENWNTGYMASGIPEPSSALMLSLIPMFLIGRRAWNSDTIIS